ncbi:MAG: prolipoprotein diacylglyceryl transferase [Chloroflexota bacterium]|nr:prolipoprotein diacylglyceryl transferase [Chloroflexota bacterium]
MIDINIDPILLRLGPLVITWHGFFTAVGVLAGIWLTTRLAVERGFTEDDIMSVALWSVVGGIVGARLLHVIDAWEFYARDPLAIVRVNEGGLAVWGSIIGGPIGGAIYARWRGLSVARLLDLGGLGLILGMAIGRLGDVVNGEHHGAATTVPWSVRYTHPQTLGDLNVPVHLAVGYELIWDVIVLAFCMWLLYRRAVPRDSMVFWSMIALYSAGRFIVQFYRLDQPFMFGLSQAQLLAFAGGVLAIWVLVYLAASARRAPADDLAAETNAIAAGRPAGVGTSGAGRRADEEPS